MSRGLISVIVPVYNTEKYVAKCLESILGNTYTNIEVLCVDDGSTDDSLKVIESFSQKDNRVKVISQKNSGVSAARNNGIMQANGEYIAFVDSDDIVSKYYFESLYELAKKEVADIVFCSYKKVLKQDATLINKSIDNSLNDYHIVTPREIMECEHQKKYIWGRIYKKSIIAI